MTRYRLTPGARLGFRNILEYVEREFGLRVAEDVLNRLASAFEGIAGNPSIGHVRPDITIDVTVRFWSVGPTLIAYRLVADGVEILFVERGECDWERLFRESL
ncbi:MAG: type II toxin-antitoxin system RelE/ParE family toxin [Planctomycetes bacterium]|nr:type II toxin-antitoxin system RelE/ParE family toxin [Planctomycetota bacterium]